MRCFLGVNKYGTKVGIEGEMAWLNPNNRRKIEMLRLWNSIISMGDHRLPKLVLNYLTTNNGTWLKNVQMVFNEINCTDVFERNVPIVNFKAFCTFATEQLVARQQIKWLTDIQCKPKLHLYCKFKNEYKTENYCTVNLKRYQRSMLAKLRLGVLPINVELGRYDGIPREERWCINCSNEVEDEIHVMFHCPLYQPLRQTLLNEAVNLIEGFYVLSEASKIKLLTSHVHMVRKTATFLDNAIKIRQQILRV